MKMYFRNDLERDFVKACKLVEEGLGRKALFMSQREIVAMAVNAPAPKFYITYEMARRNVSAILKGHLPDCRNKLKMQMYADIARLTVDYQRRHSRYANDFNGALMAVLSEYLLPYVKVGGKALCWKGPALMEELPQGRKAAYLLGGKVQEPISITFPGRDWQHMLLPIAKAAKTARQYPRKAGTPGKQPLGASAPSGETSAKSPKK